MRSSYKELFEECQTARDEAGFLGPVPECIRDLSERTKKLQETLNFVREAVFELLPADASGDALKVNIIHRIDSAAVLTVGLDGSVRYPSGDLVDFVDPSSPPPAAEMALADAMDAAWVFVQDGIQETKREHGLFGVWGNAFRSGWTAAIATTTPPEKPKSD